MKCLSKDIIEEISKSRGEPDWLREFRSRSYDIFMSKPMPNWAPEASKIDFQNFSYYYERSSEERAKSLPDVPETVRRSRGNKFVDETQVKDDSQMAYLDLREDLEQMGVVCVGINTAVKIYPELVERYLGEVIPPEDNKFAALNGAIWSEGSFIYLPPSTKTKAPLYSPYETNTDKMGHIQRNLVIADEGAELHYVEGCPPQVNSAKTESLNSSVTELIVMKGAKIKYVTIQNSSKNAYNFVSKRAYAYEDARVEWIDGNLGGRLTMKYPSVYLLGRNAHAEILSFTFAGSGQLQDVGAKAIHSAPNTTSNITSRSISNSSGRITYRILAHAGKGSTGAKADIRSDALILDENTETKIYPHFEVSGANATASYKGAVRKVSEEQLFYLMSRGYSESDAVSVLVDGFMEPFTRALPMEYAVELDRLVRLEIEGTPDSSKGA